MNLLGTTQVLNKPYTFIKKIGEGGFGKVYRVNDSNNDRYAIKVISSGTKGIPCLMEASIMNTLKHPYLNTAIDTIVVDDSLFIVQEEAVCDLFDYIKSREVSKTETVKIMNHLVQAVSFLHREDIIHGDIKTSNVLVYEYNGSHVFKLSDFNLSTNKNWKITESVCTDSYRPLDGWNVKWDSSIDIWCIALVIYTCLKGEYLFASQRSLVEKKRYRSYYNALWDWEKMYYRHLRESVPNRKYYNVEYHPPEVGPEIFSKDPLYKLLFNCLHPNKDKRPTADQLLNHYILSSHERVSGFTLKVSPLIAIGSNRPHKLVARPKHLIIDKPQNPITSASIAHNIFTRYEPYIKHDKQLVIATISMMAMKLMREKEIEIDSNTNTIFRIERDICRKLNFVLC